MFLYICITLQHIKHQELLNFDFFSWRIRNLEAHQYTKKSNIYCYAFVSSQYVYDGLQRKGSHALHHSFIFETINVIYVQIVWIQFTLFYTFFCVVITDLLVPKISCVPFIMEFIMKKIHICGSQIYIRLNIKELPLNILFKWNTKKKFLFHHFQFWMKVIYSSRKMLAWCNL